MSNKFRVVFVFILILLMGPGVERLEAQSKKISGDNYFGCTDRDYFEKLESYIVQKDIEAFKKGLTTGVSLGRCTLFKRGEEIFLLDRTIPSGLVKVRRKGDIVEYWTPIKATYSYDE